MEPSSLPVSCSARRHLGRDAERSHRIIHRFKLAALPVLLSALASPPAGAADRDIRQFEEQVQPILEDHCYSCHGNGSEKGGVSFDGLASDERRRLDRKLWSAALKNVRAGLMPPAEKPRLSDEERQALEGWIKSVAFGIDPDDPDPGRVTVRRLNRVEYRNTVRDLMGVDYDTTAEFPPDDTGHGFDNIGDVLTISPLLLEKYLAAARAIVTKAVPTASGVPAEALIPGQRFRKPGEGADEGGKADTGPLSLSYYEPAVVATTVQAPHDGHYQLILDLTASERYVDGIFDYNKCRLIFRADGEELHRQDFSRQEGRPFRLVFDRTWQAGAHELAIEVEPLTPDQKQVRSLALRVHSVTLRGPLEPEYWTRPQNYVRFFPGTVPEAGEARRQYARDLLARFASRAFRRPVDDNTAERLVALAEGVSAEEGQTFEAGIAQAMIAVLASPRFLFREEGIEPDAVAGRHPYIDEYALASRLSYFLWSSMPDDELLRLASRHELRQQLRSQVDRMLADPRSSEFIRQFVGQWLQARDIDTVIINAFAVLSRDEPPDPDAEARRRRFRELRRKAPDELTEAEKKELDEARAKFFGAFGRFRAFELNRELRRAMRRETEMTFEHILRDERSLLELLDSNYTFLNERLAKHYGIEGVQGDELRKVELPPDSPRGGVLTQGTVLAVTSNPDRTSPVKRGLFILENILGVPPAPPPPDIPPLEDATKGRSGPPPTLRETLAVHRSMPLCHSCHNRMDPLGLAFENYNALGRWRDKDRGQPIDAAGTLITGEPFADVRELKRVLVTDRRRDFYRCLSAKMLTYALGRGLEDQDVATIDALVDRIERENGRASALLMGIIESAPFQKRRRPIEDQTVQATVPDAEAGELLVEEPRAVP
jgi:mono/diheme cytochrome c family protein